MNRLLRLVTCIPALVVLLWAGQSATGERRPDDDATTPSIPEFRRIGPDGGEVRSLLIDSKDSSFVTLGTSNGQLFRSTDGGRSWLPLVPGPGRRGLVFDTLVQHPTDSERLFVGAWDLGSNGGGLFESRDGGRNWSEVHISSSPLAVRDLAFCRARPSVAIVGTLSGAFLSDDGGNRWHLAGGGKAPFQTVESVGIDPRDPRLLYVGTWRLAFRSADSGRTWRRVERGMPLDSDVFSIAVVPSQPGVVFSSACSGVYRSSDSVLTWRRLRLLPDRFTVRAHIVFVDPGDARRVYSGTTEGLFLSTDGGEKWTRITPDRLTINAIQVDPRDPRSILIGTSRSGVLRSSDGGRTWADSSRGFSQRQVARIAADPEQTGRFIASVTGVGIESGLYSFDEPEGRWTRMVHGPEGGFDVLSLLVIKEPRVRLAGTRNGIFKQDRPGGSWIRLEGLSGRMTANSFLFDAGGNWVYAATDRGIYRARPDGLVFSLPPASPIRPRVASLAQTGGNPNYIYAGTSFGVLKSATHGDTWEFVTHGLPEGSRVGAIAVCPADRDHLFAGTSAGLYETSDGGRYWRRARAALPMGEINSIVYVDPPGESLLASENDSGGLYLSEDDGRSWRKLTQPGYESTVRQIVADPSRRGRLFLATNSDGVYRLNLPVSSGVAGN